ncbi:MAG: HAD-IC family P-type ATPase [Candidatus Pacebacteria bacterium]|nr:HAD-IC family P-type ATPase [Candidatus Paceibacterota bacterium]
MNVDILNDFKTSERGLTSKEALLRLERYGKNEIKEKKPEGIFSIFLNQFKSPLIYILIFVCLVVFLMGEWIDAIIISIILVFNAIVGSIQEGKAENTLLALKNFVETKATVKRDDQEIIISDKELVPGDIIILQEGEKIPADAIIISSNGLKVNEAAMTGESNPVYKEPEKNNLVLRGMNILSGNGKAVVTKTGNNTFIGKIAKKIINIETEIPLKKNISFLSQLIIRSVLILCVLIFLIGIYHNHSIQEMILTIVTLSVSIIPEGLPIVITLVLATGVWRMSKKNALVKKLQAVEALGQANIIAVDKTGTLTRNEMIIQRVFVNNTFYDIDGVGYEPKGEIKINEEVIDPVDEPNLIFLAKMASFCAEARVVFSEEEKLWQISGDPTEAAILVFSQKIGFHKDELIRNNPKIEEKPFDYEQKYRSSVYKIEDKNILTVTGAPEIILNLCTKIWKNNREYVISPEEKEELEKTFYEMLKSGLRVIALAKKNNPSSSDDVNELSFIGFLGMKDALRLEVIESIKKAQDAGIKIVMITGDHKVTAKSIALESGIYKKGDIILTGKDLDDLEDEEILKNINNVSIFARVNPEHKLRIVNLFKSQGKIIAMTGDGVNDAPSLIAADLGISMGKIGTEVAKEASDIILLDDNFKTIVSAIEEGRAIYKTIKKVILYLLSTSLGEVLVIVGALLLNYPLPVLAVQIIWLNFVTDGFLDVALAMDSKEKDILKQKFHRPNKYLIDKIMIQRMIMFSLIIGFGTLLLFKQYYLIDMTKALTISLTTLAVFQWFNAWNCRSEKESIFNPGIFSNKYLIGATLIVVSLQFLAIYNPFFQAILKTAPLNFSEWLMIILVSSSIVIFEELRKIISKIKST